MVRCSVKDILQRVQVRGCTGACLGDCLAPSSNTGSQQAWHSRVWIWYAASDMLCECGLMAGKLTLADNTASPWPVRLSCIQPIRISFSGTGARVL